jgi:hypothetical protein
MFSKNWLFALISDLRTLCADPVSFKGNRACY